MSIELRLTDEVRHALNAGAPVVALESTIVAHGFPYPEGLEVAQALHEAVMAAGAVPAMIAILNGEVRIGLDDQAIERVARAEGVLKCGIADIAAACARGVDGATTVSASITLAGRAEIGVFATGGLGGVHRMAGGGGTHPPDISADLVALSRTPVTVVSSGAKMLLDLPATVEALETLGVPVLGYRTDHFPAFYLSSSGIPLRHRFDDISALASAVRAQRAAVPSVGVLICNPPPDSHALAPEELEGWVAEALDEADGSGVTGGDVTPYVLDALHRMSGGRTVACNKALAVSNAEVGGRLAVALAGETAT